MDKLMRWFLACVFLIAIVGKLRGTRGDTIWDSSPRSARWLVLISEITMVVWLASGWRTRQSGTACILLFLLFNGVIALELTKPDPKPCGCGLPMLGTDADNVRRSLAADLVRNLCLMILAGYVSVSARGRALDPAGTRSTEGIASNTRGSL